MIHDPTVIAIAITVLALLALAAPANAREVWTRDQANQWYGKQKWLVGSNYIPADAINQLEMWQADSFNPAQIDKELGWAQGLGMTTMRVFLHDALWSQDPAGFTNSVRSIRRSPACTIPVGCNRPAPRRWLIRRNMRDLKSL